MRTPNLNDLIADLQTAKQIAIDDRNPNAIVTATMSQAKLLGMDNMRNVTPHSNKIEVTRTIVDPLTPDAALAISNQLDNEY